MAGGDFNSHPGSTCPRVVQSVGAVADSWESAHGSAMPDEADVDLGMRDTPDAMRYEELCVEQFGCTCDSRINSWRSSCTRSARRYDYVFHDASTTCVEARVVFTERIPGLDVSYSDHFGVEVVLQYQAADRTVKETRLDRNIWEHIDDLGQRYVAREQRHFVWRLLHLALTVPCALGLLLGSVWVPRVKGTAVISFVLGFLAVLVGISGTGNGFMIGLLFGRWELRAMTEFRQELDLYRVRYGDDALSGSPYNSQLSSPDAIELTRLPAGKHP